MIKIDGRLISVALSPFLRFIMLGKRPTPTQISSTENNTKQNRKIKQNKPE